MSEKHLFDKKLRDLDPAIWSLAREKELGELRKVYHASKRETPIMVLGMMCLLWAVLWILASVIVVLTSLLHSSPVSPVWILPGFILAVAGCYLVLPGKMYARWQVYLWESGFVYEKGQLRQVFRWDQIEDIQGSAGHSPQQGITVFNYKVRRQDGYEVKLNNVFLDGTELIDTVVKEFLRQAAQELRMVPPRDRTFAHQFKIDRQGISDRQGALSWQDMQELTIENGTMAILKREPGFSKRSLERNYRSYI